MPGDRLLHVALLALVGCGSPDVAPNLGALDTQQAAWDMVAEQGPAPGGNVVVIVLDDVGVDKIGAYGLHPEPAKTPVFDELVEEGVLFRNAWAEPSCSPTRAAALTGRNPSQTGIGRWIHSEVNPVELAQDEVTLAELLAPADYTSAVAGKWHLTEWSDGEDPAMDALDQGFARHRGSMANPPMTYTLSEEPGEDGGYYFWEKNVDGTLEWTDVYMTVDTANEAVAFMEEVDGPFFLWVAFNAPHTPLHRPPGSLLSEPLPNQATADQLYSAMVEAADREIGRILDSMTEEQRESTTVIILGDNGTADVAMTAPSDVGRSKDTVFDGGVRVPLLVVGPYVQTPGESEAFVQTTDVFATVAHIAGIDVATMEGLDSASFLPQVVDPSYPGSRAVLFAEEFINEKAAWTLRDSGYKLIRRDHDVKESLFRYEEGGFDEGADLLLGELSEADRDALRALRTQLRFQRRWMRRHRKPANNESLSPR